MTSLTMEQAAEKLGISVRGLRRLVKSGAIPQRRPSPGRVAIDLADVEAYWERVKTGGTQQQQEPRRGGGSRPAPSSSNPVLDQALALQRQRQAEKRRSSR